MQWASIISDVFIALAAAVASIVAIKGYGAWKRELRWRTEYELARRLLIGVYKLRDAISSVRNHFMLSSEYTHRGGRDNQNIGRDAEDLRFAYSNRWERITEALTLDADFYEAEALLDDAFRKHWENLRGRISVLHFQVQLHISEEAEGVRPDSRTANREIVYGDGSDDDRFAKTIQHVIQEIASSLKPILRRKK